MFNPPGMSSRHTFILTCINCSIHAPSSCDRWGSGRTGSKQYFSISRTLGYFRGNLGLGRVKVALEVGRSSLSRKGQLMAIQAKGRAEWSCDKILTGMFSAFESMFSEGWGFGDFGRRKKLGEMRPVGEHTAVPAP